MANLHRSLPEDRLPRVILAMALAYALVGLAYLLSKSVLSADPEIDLKYIWVAGRLWAEGINPYSGDFARIGDTYFEDSNRLDTWLYPPNWWVISRSLALFEIDTAALLWRSFNAGLVCGGVLLAVQAWRPHLRRLWPVAGLVLFGYATTLQATATVLSIGQTSIILFFGICALFFGLMRGQTAWVVAGLALVALKPNVGIVIWAGVAALPTQWRAIGMASLVTLLLCLPSVLVGGIGPTFGGLISAYLHYDGALEVNSPANTTGLRHLAETMFGVELSAVYLSLAAALVAWFGGIAMRHRGTESDAGRLLHDLPCWVILVTVTFVALHSYDFIIAAPLLLVCFAGVYPSYLRVAIALGLVLIYRSTNLADATGFQHPDTLYHTGSRIDSLVSLAMFFIFAAHAFISRPDRPKLGQPR